MLNLLPPGTAVIVTDAKTWVIQTPDGAPCIFTYQEHDQAFTTLKMESGGTTVIMANQTISNMIIVTAEIRKDIQAIAERLKAAKDQEEKPVTRQPGWRMFR